jgi:hypothetical protein
MHKQFRRPGTAYKWHYLTKLYSGVATRRLAGWTPAWRGAQSVGFQAGW